MAVAARCAGGAATLALVTANLFYVVFLPSLAVAWWLAEGREGDRSARRRTRRSDLLAAAVGLTALFLMLCALYGIATGRWFFLESSLRFVAKSVDSPNIWTQGGYGYLARGYWLVLPAVTVVGAVATIARGGLRSSRSAVLVQVQYLFVALVYVGVDLGTKMAPLEHFYYVSMVLGPAARALAGQLEPLLGGVSATSWRWLAPAVGVTGCLGLAFDTSVPRLLRMLPAPVVTPFLIGALALGLAISMRRRLGHSACATAVLGLLVANWLVREGQGVLRLGPPYDRRNGQLFLQMDRAIAELDRVDAERRWKLWYDGHQPTIASAVFDSIASSYLFCPRLASTGFPRLDSLRICGDTVLGPGSQLAVLSDDGRAAEKAHAALARLGLESRLENRITIPGPLPGFEILLLRIVASRAAA